jgi:hypothetical protein
MATKFVSAADVVRFRDQAWVQYHTNSAFLNNIESRFGLEARTGIEDLTKITLRRKILGD